MTVSPFPENEPLPPLDVLMIWHTYMLSPSKYYQDSELKYPVIKNLGGMPWDKIVCHDLSINNNNLIAETYRLSGFMHRQKYWTLRSH
jgi:hypothetical protein